MKNTIINYFLNNKIYTGDIYIKMDKSEPCGFICFSDPNYQTKLDIRICEINNQPLDNTIDDLVCLDTCENTQFSSDVIENQHVCLNIDDTQHPIHAVVEKKPYKYQITSLFCSIMILINLLFL